MKDRMIDSIVKSNRSLATAQPVTGKVIFPDMALIRTMTLDQLTKLTITKVQWYQDYCHILGFTMSDGQTCKAGTNCDYNNSFDFCADIKIVKVEFFLTNDKYMGQINFYGKDG